MQYLVEAQGLWYEGSEAWLRLMQGRPTILPFVINTATLENCGLFIEDYFNSSTRVRRGRLFQSSNRNIWRASMVSRFPYQDLRNPSDVFNINRAYITADIALKTGSEIVLGDNNATSNWIVILNEKMGFAENYVTLKSKTFLGVLPEIDRSKIPEGSRDDIIAALDAVVEAASSLAPQSVIDACRNAANYMISAMHPASNPEGKEDLGGLVTWLIKEGRLKSCRDAAAAVLYLLEAETSHLVNMLHSRGKANAAANHGTRPVSRRDADLAVSAIAFLLQDFCWAAHE